MWIFIFIFSSYIYYKYLSKDILSPEFTQTQVHRVLDAIQPSHPLSSPSPPALNLSQYQGLFQARHIRWPKYWSFSFSISPSSEYSGLISFTIAVQGTLKNLPQHHSSKASILWCWAFFMVQLWLLEKPTLTILSGKWCLCFLICCLGLS